MAAFFGSGGGSSSGSIAANALPVTQFVTNPIALLSSGNADMTFDTSGGAVAQPLPSIAAIPPGEVRTYRIKKSDPSLNPVSFVATGVDRIEQINSNPIAFGPTLSWTNSSCITLESDTVNNTWLIV